MNFIADADPAVREQAAKAVDIVRAGAYNDSNR